ncbi:FUSC family protein [Bradyrhizobium uaiense]|uniref:FUSC family protein n=1 Tax=Bradyrhizobium uaiense TaxID=2594946 RepID=A0A6P1BCN3_9BRAD|nr:FUSC family protein [Bradyrhizobium uaiense]NEU95252.1 FUSC family protein [Bradyrhizobium uaiense]
MSKPERTNISSLDFVYAFEMAIAALLSYWAMTAGLTRLVDTPTDLLGGMWAAVSAIFVFREKELDSVSAGIARLAATGVSFALCLPYLWFFPATPLGIAVLVAIGAVIMILLHRRGDIITTGITTVVVMVVAAIDPHDSWRQPLLRLADTVVGISIGVACQWIGFHLLQKVMTARHVS